MAINNSNGLLEGNLKVSELVEYLKEHMEFYGDTEVDFLLSGDDETRVQFEHYKDSLVIDIYEEF